MLKKCIFIILLGLLLTGCKQQSREAYLIRHQAEFKTILQQCTASPEMMRTKECKFVMRLYKQEMRLIRQLTTNPVQYGKDILSLQMKQGALQERILLVEQALQQPSITTKKQSQLNQTLQRYQQKIDEVTRQIEMRLALLAIAEKM
jgi:hypothetical protein